MGRLLARQGNFAFTLTKPDQPRKLLEESLVILRQHEAHREIAFALLKLSEETMFHESNPAGAKVYLQESLTLFEKSGDMWGMAYVVRWLGFAALLMEDFEEAWRLCQESLAICEKNGDQWGAGITLSLVGLAALALGDYQAAKKAGQESVALCRELDLLWGMMQGLISLGSATCALGEYEESKQAFSEALKITYEGQLVGDILWVLVESTNLWIAFGKLEWALELLAFSLHQSVPPALGRSHTARALTKLEAQLPVDTARAAIERGKMRDLDSIVTETLAELKALRRPSFNPLSEREMEILHLLAAGLTNQEIAEKLFLVLGTIKSHNNRIFSKLNVNNRAQAIKRARELGLI